MLKIYNTLSRSLEEFKPIEEGKVSFYHCGPTVYSAQHIGNLRATTLGDFIRRSLQYLGYEVRHVRNYTDVGHLVSDGDEGEDKMEKGVRKEGLQPLEIAQKYIDQFERDTKALNILEPNVKPRATEYIPQMIEMVQILLDKGFAYATPLAIYFDVSKAKDYTKLSGQKLDLNLEGAGHGEVDDLEGKKNAADFAVWFFRTGSHAKALQYWPSPFIQPENTPADLRVKDGNGFPGWHIECSAMSKQELGETIDLHMGGIEHIPTHHPNEIAQSESANGVKFVNYWIHNEHLNVNGGKMAKSEGTGILVSEIEEKGFSALDLRYFFLQAHYRSKQNFTWESLEAARTAYTRLQNKLKELIASIQDKQVLEPSGSEFEIQFTEALEDDFNLPQALATLWEMLKSDLSSEHKLGLAYKFDKVLGLELETFVSDPREAREVPEAAQKLIDQRAAARQNKDWAEADQLRQQLWDEYGIEVKDTSEGQQINY